MHFKVTHIQHPQYYRLCKYFLFYSFSFYLEKSNFFKNKKDLSAVAKHDWLYFLAQIYTKLRPLFLIIVLGFGLYAYSHHMLTFRYSSTSISNNPLGMLSSVLNYLLMADALYFTFCLKSKKRRVWDIISACSLVLFSSGIISAITGFFVLVLTLLPKLKTVALSKITVTRRNFFLYCIGLLLIPLMFNFATNFGATIKHGTYDFSISSVLDPSSYSVNKTTSSAPELIGRIASHYISLLATSQNLFDNGYNFIDMYSIPINGLIYRARRIMKLNAYSDKPYNSTIAQYNYRNITQGKTKNRTGSTPGVIAAFNYFFLFPLNLLFVSIYLVFIEHFINTITYCYPKLNFAVAFFLSRTFFYWCFASPFDLINIIDGGTLYVLLCLMIYLQMRRKMKFQLIAKNTLATKSLYASV